MDTWSGSAKQVSVHLVAGLVHNDTLLYANKYLFLWSEEVILAEDDGTGNFDGNCDAFPFLESFTCTFIGVTLSAGSKTKVRITPKPQNRKLGSEDEIL